MFEYRYPLLEVVQAIEEIRESRGTTNKQICDFVRQQGRNPNDPMKILKTIRTLNKLVEEGVLIKKGKRYVFPTKPPELSDNTDEGQEEEEQDQDMPEEDSCDEDNEDNEDEEGGEEEEEEEEDDDDDDEEEEDDDDDDDEDEDEECEDQEQIPEPENKPPSCPEKTASKGLNQQKSPLNGESKPTENVGANQEGTDKRTSDNIVTKKNSLKGGRKSGKGQNCGETKNNNGKSKGGEAIAFCARDFIDSQYSQNSTPAKPVALHEKPQDDLIEIENYESEPLARAFGIRKRESKSRKNRAGNDCRSRSPIRSHMKNGFFTDLNLNHSEDLRKNMINSQIFQEVAGTPMEIDHDNEVVDLDFDILRHRSPIGPPSITPGVHLDRTESCCSQPNKGPENIKAEPDFDCKTQFFLKKNVDFKHSRHSMARAIDMQNKKLAKEAAEKDKEKHKRELCSEDGNGIKAEKRGSLCSVCEKKKRNS